MKIFNLRLTKKWKVFLLLLWIIVSVNCLFQTVTINERNSYKLQCPSDAILTVLSAVYSSYSCNQCVYSSHSCNQCDSLPPSNCSINIIDRIRNMCDKHNFCIIESNNNNYGDPCVGRGKYASITYSCHLENSIFLPEIENKYTNKTLNNFYDEFVVSFVMLSNGKTIEAFIAISYNDEYIMDINVNSNGELVINTLNTSCNVKITASTLSSISISQSFINDSIYNINITVDGTVQCSNINIKPMVFTDVFLNTFAQCFLNSGCYSLVSIKNLSVYSKTQVIWTQWSEWSQCNASCVLSRSRCCRSILLLNCIRQSTEVESCNNIYQEVVLTENEFPLAEEKLIATIKKLNEEHSISFEIKPPAFVFNDCVRVIHLTGEVIYSTAEDNDPTNEYHTPSVWFKPNEPQCLYICFAFNRDNKNCESISLELYKWYKVNISQKYSSGKYNYFIQVNETIIFNEENIVAREFSNVKVYVSNNSNNVQKEFIRNLKITNGNAVPWAEWNGWSSCSVSYGNGFMKRTRMCDVLDNVCCHDNYKLKECFSFWTPWNIWSNCSDFFGLINRTRECSISNTTDWCDGVKSEVTEFSVFWAKWSDWQKCNNSYGFKKRTRECIDLNISKMNYVTQSGLLEHTEFFVMEKITLLSNGRLITIIERLSKKYSVSFEFNPIPINSDKYRNIIHLTIGEDWSNYGSRIPAVWFGPGQSSLLICSALNNISNFCFHKNHYLKLGNWFYLKISQDFLNGKYMYSIQLNSEVVKYVENEKAREFLNVKVYVSDPWYDAQPGYIRNLRIVNGNQAFSSFLCNLSSCNDTYRNMFKTEICYVTNDQCYGENYEFTNCYAFWTPWSNWSICNGTYGFTNRSRSCNASNPNDLCDGNNFDLMECYDIWSVWSECNDSCVVTRTRNCSNNQFLNCFEKNTKVESCSNIYQEVVLTENTIPLSEMILIATIEKLKKEYSISFEIKPLNFIIYYWVKVIHLTVGGNEWTYGYHFPSVWFTHYNAKNVYICFAFSGKSQKCEATTLVTHSWSTVNLSQSFFEGKYNYSIQFNGSNIFNEINTDAREFSNVKVYVSANLTKLQTEFVRSLKITNGNAEVVLTENEISLSEEKFIARLEKLNEEYSISFEIKPHGFIINDWVKVIQLISGVNDWNFEKIALVWFQPNKTDVLDICFAFSEDNEYCKTATISSYNWSKVDISQRFFKGKYNYSIQLDRKIIFNQENTDAREFSYVNVYVSANLTNVQTEFVRNLKITNGNAVPWGDWNIWSSCNVSYGNGFMNRTRACNILNKICCDDDYELKECFTSFYLQYETQLSKKNLVTTISRLFKEYTVSFEVKLTAVHNKTSSPLNVFHLTTNSDCGTYGYRTPAMWMQYGIFYICSAVNSNPDYCKSTAIFEPGNWNSFKVSQQLFDLSYMYSIQHNCTTIFSEINSNPREFSNVKVYVSDPWYDAQPALIRNLKITNGKPAFWSKWSTWSSCNVKYGYMNRTRECTVYNAFDFCCGDNFDVTECYVLWTSWRTLSTSNDSYESIKRTRQCNVSNDIDWCHGNSVESVENSVIWTQWSNWSDCNISNRLKNRKRECITLNVMEWCSTKPNSLECSQVYLIKDKTKLSKGNLVKTIKKLEKEFSVYFEIQPTVFSNGFHNVIHLTTGVNLLSFGYRNLGVWFDQSGDGALYICYDKSKIDNCYKTDRVELGHWSSIKISQTYFQGAYNYSTELNGKMINNQQNYDAREFSNVNVYVSNPLVEAQIGFIRNLKITNGNSALWSNCSSWPNYNVIFGSINTTYDCNATNSMKVCYGNSSENVDCFAFWSQWTNWTGCNATYGFMNRTRECNISNLLDGCYGNNSEVIECFAFWSQWTNWTSCNATYGFINRTRTCKTSSSLYGCYGNNTEVMECFAFWSQWSSWSSCNGSYWFTNRSRECNTSTIVDWCVGNKIEVKQCIDFWSQWGDWTNCNGTYRVMNRTRECNISSSADGCYVNGSGVMECFAFWSQWSNWTGCNSTNGFINRTRACNISNNLNQCNGVDSEVMQCFVFWDQWSNWTGCNEFNRFMNRSRMCKMLNTADICFGDSSEEMECPAYWSQWSIWTVCNGSYGFVNRTRECDISNAKDWCYVNNSEILECFASWAQWNNLISCDSSIGILRKFRDCKNSNVIDWCHGNNVEIMEYFDKWTTWSECSVTCGMGNRTRYSQHEKIKVMKVENCYQINCPEDGMWGNWSISECLSKCGKGIKFVNRRCDKPTPSYNGRDCIGVNNYTEDCDNDIICPINGKWSMWSSLSLCSQPCGDGLQSKYRSCSNPAPSFGGQDCYGNFEEFFNCSMQICKSVKLNLNMNFIDEKYDSYSMEAATDILSDKIQEAIAKLYSNRKVSFHVVIHSIENGL